MPFQPPRGVLLFLLASSAATSSLHARRRLSSYAFRGRQRPTSFPSSWKSSPVWASVHVGRRAFVHARGRDTWNAKAITTHARGLMKSVKRCKRRLIIAAGFPTGEKCTWKHRALAVEWINRSLIDDLTEQLGHRPFQPIGLAKFASSVGIGCEILHLDRFRWFESGRERSETWKWRRQWIAVLGTSVTRN